MTTTGRGGPNMPTFPFQSPLAYSPNTWAEGSVREIRKALQSSNPEQVLAGLEQIDRHRDQYQDRWGKLEQLALRQAHRWSGQQDYLWTPLLDQAYRVFGNCWKISSWRDSPRLMASIWASHEALRRCSREETALLAEYQYPPFLKAILAASPQVDGDLLDQLLERLWQAWPGRADDQQGRWQGAGLEQRLNFFRQALEPLLAQSDPHPGGIERAVYWARTGFPNSVLALQKVVRADAVSTSLRVEALRCCRERGIDETNLTQLLFDIEGACHQLEIVREALPVASWGWAQQALADVSRPEYPAFLEQAMTRWPHKVGTWLLEAPGVRGTGLTDTMIRKYYLEQPDQTLRQMGVRLTRFCKPSATGRQHDE